MKLLASILLLIAFFSDLSFAGGTYVDNGNSTITDKQTGLMWVKTDTTGTKAWAAALGYCEALTLAGKSDWRLPNRNELQTLMDYSKATAPVINTTYFPNAASSRYWSSTSYAPGPSGAWNMGFSNGEGISSPKNFLRYVRCVR